MGQHNTLGGRVEFAVCTCRLARRRFGLLEKKKDYKLRANDYHKKEETLQVPALQLLRALKSVHHHRSTSVDSHNHFG
jgi:hypothetical protein